MRQFALKNTNLIVSEIALGAMHLGTAIEESRAFLQLDTFLELGGRLIDTAHVYGNWVPGASSPSEETLGKWLRHSGKRSLVTVSTKGGHPDLQAMETMRLHDEELEKDLNESLEKLGIETIDLYFLHRDDPDIPVEDILGFLERQVKKGKIRYYGCSNWRLPRLKKAAEIAAQNEYTGFVCDQEMFSLADVNTEAIPPTNVAVDAERREYYKASGLPLMAYMSLSRGYFSKTLQGKELNSETAATYDNDSNRKIAAFLRNYVSEEADALAYCLQYLTRQEFQTVPVAGFSSIAQLRQADKALEARIPQVWLDRLAACKTLQ